MAVPIENIHVGEFVALSEYLGEMVSVFGHRKPEFNGQPFEVVAVSPPFVALVDPLGTVRSIDLREWGLTKVSREYARKTFIVQDVSPEPMKRQRTRRRRAKTRPDPDSCPRCGYSRLRQKLAEDEEGRRFWVTFCPECGFDKGLVESA